VATDWQGSSPPDYVDVLIQRQHRLRKIRSSPVMLAGALEYYRTRPATFIEHWCSTYDPRKSATDAPTTMPFVPFPRQRDLIDFLSALIDAQQGGLIEKARDMGATWLSCAFSVWAWRFLPGASIGWGSRKEQLVDKIGDPDSIFEKMRITIRNLPREFWPAGFDLDAHMPFMKIVNPETGATITGEAGDNIGRGGRKLIYFKDESAHYERPEKIEAALADTTNVQIDISSVNGVGNVFHRRREAGREWRRGRPLATDRANVFVMDWSDHPAKDQAWYDQRRAKAEADGLLHVFAQEVDRNYAAAVEGIIIPAVWVTAAIDAHVTLGWEIDGRRIAGLDVADGGIDKNAIAIRQGPVLTDTEEWGERDTALTARKAIAFCGDGPTFLQYDAIGVGAGVKAETNRLRDEGLLPDKLLLTPWMAGAAPLKPDDPVIPGDPDSPLNRDFYANLKAQAWWSLRQRFERTYRAVVEGAEYASDDMISLPSTLPNLATVRKELSQATRGSTGALKLVVNKSPEGTKSPNLADAIVMAFWPAALSLPFESMSAGTRASVSVVERDSGRRFRDNDGDGGIGFGSASSNSQGLAF
jgi:hypothetical protein